MEFPKSQRLILIIYIIILCTTLNKLSTYLTDYSQEQIFFFFLRSISYSSWEMTKAKGFIFFFIGGNCDMKNYLFVYL